MRVRFETFFRAVIVFLVTMLAWSIWATAQTATNQPVLSAPNQPSALVRRVERLEEHPPAVKERFDAEGIGFA
jgi:hypothetical protein